MILGEEFSIIDNFFYIHFTENYGMAFGLEFGGETGKLFLSLIRLVLISGIGWYLFNLIKKKATNGAIVCFSLILAGAMGNMIDSMFYGIVFSDSLLKPATFLPPGGGYAGFLHGRVVDMFYFPICEGFYPDWIPILGGKYFSFFRHIFNLADASITTGILTLLIFQKRFFPKKEESVSAMGSAE